MNNNYKVYKHTTPSGKVYIGQTKQELNDRWLNGKGYQSNSYFWKAIQKYGWNNIQHEILADGLTEDEANELEVVLIRKYNSTDHSYGYNIQEGGNNASPSEETRKKMSEAQLNGHNYMRGRKGQEAPWYGKCHSQITKEKISKSRKGKCCGADNHNFGKSLPQDTKEKLSKSLKDHWATHPHPNKGKKLSEEQIQRMSVARKGKYMGVDNKMSKSVLQIDLDTGAIVAEYAGVKEAARMTGAIASKISACCVGKRHKHHGYAWCHK